MTRPMPWMTAVRDHPKRPPSRQREVLYCLALRMDWATGCGFASTGQLADDAECDERTVKRATRWGRDQQMLVQSRRGHRTGDGSSLASEWRLSLPSQGDTGDPLSEQSSKGQNSASRGQRSHLKGTAESSQGDTGDTPYRTSSSRTSSSARGDGANAPRPPRAAPETPPLPPPCPYCGTQLTREEFDALDADWRQIALSGDMACENPDCPMAVA